jgi:hypothetical protein
VKKAKPTREKVLSRRGRARRVAATFGVVSLLSGAVARGDELDDLKERARKLVQELESQIEAARGERKALEAERRNLREGQAASAPTAPPAGETDRKVDVLVGEVERLKSAIVLPESKELKSQYGLGPAASKVYQQTRGLSIGGYGEAFYTRILGDKRGDTADALRFVLYTGYKFSDRIVLNTEVEFEHATTGETVSSEPGEVAVEFAYLDFFGWDWLNARAGLVLVPMGFINEIHEPVYFHGVNRPEVERRIIPTTWSELGVGLFGSLPGDLQYRTYFTTSLNARGFGSSGIRDGRQGGQRAIAESPAGSGRIDWTPSYVPGLLLGGSFFVGETGQAKEFAGKRIDGLFTLWDAHAQYRWRGLELRALFVEGELGEAAAISQEVEQTVGDRSRGFYVEAAYDILPHVLPTYTRQSFLPFVRYESLDPNQGAPTGFERDRTRDVELYTAGFTFKPHPQVAIKFDYRTFEVAKGRRANEINTGIGFVF